MRVSDGNTNTLKERELKARQLDLGLWILMKCGIQLQIVLKR